MRRWLKRYGLVMIMALFASAGVGMVALWGASLGVDRGRLQVVGTFEAPTIVPDGGTPLAPFALVDLRLLDLLQNPPLAYEQSMLQADISGIPVVGAYLPRTGDTLFDSIVATTTPTPLPFPTSPPLPLPPIVGDPVLPEVPDDVARTLPYGGDACAPAGMPIQGILTQRFHTYHSGIDIGIPSGTPVLATHSGVVTFASLSDVGYGYLVIIQNGNFITYYAHNTSFNVNANQIIGKGSIIAWSGSTGNSTGPHVHYETRINDVPVDPLTFESRGYPSC